MFREGVGVFFLSRVRGGFGLDGVCDCGVVEIEGMWFLLGLGGRVVLIVYTLLQEKKMLLGVFFSGWVGFASVALKFFIHRWTCCLCHLSAIWERLATIEIVVEF